MDQLLDHVYDKAAKSFDEVERQHPYSVWATKAQLMSAYALYEAAKYDESIVAADRFIQLHPGHRDVAYAYYLKALDYYVQIADVARDRREQRQREARPDSEHERERKLVRPRRRFGDLDLLASAAQRTSRSATRGFAA